MKIQVMSKSGDSVLAEVTNETSVEELALVTLQFRKLQANGYRAFTRRGVRVDRFSPEIDEDIVFVAPLMGG